VGNRRKNLGGEKMEDQERYLGAIEKLYYDTLTPDEQQEVKRTVIDKNPGNLPKILSGLYDYLYENKGGSTEKSERCNKIFNFLLKNEFYDVVLL
jgi:hypothetical protein